MKKTGKKSKFSSFRIKFSDFSENLPASYSHLSFRQVFGKFRKLPFWKIDQTLKTLATRDSRQVLKFSESSSKKFQVFATANLLCDWVRGKFSRNRIFPLHYMEGMRYPPWMEWRYHFFASQI